MNGNAMVYPGEYPPGTPSLGNVDLTYVRPIDGASHHWSSRQLTSGPLLQWVDRVSGAVMVPPSPAQAPLVYSGMRRVVRFSGTDFQRTAVPLELSGARTFVVVAGFAKAQANQMLTYGYDAGTFWNLWQGSNGKFAFSAGKTMVSGKNNDTSRHVFLIVSNGANSVFNIDGEEWFGDAGSTPAKGFRIGSNATEYFGFDVEAVAVLPFAANAARRASIVAQLKKEHGFVI